MYRNKPSTAVFHLTFPTERCTANIYSMQDINTLITEPALHVSQYHTNKIQDQIHAQHQLFIWKITTVHELTSLYIT